MLFDRSRTLSLNLFEHVHGESRARGQAMVDLLETYRAGGFEPVGSELPDHLPMLLEFLASRPLAEAREVLTDAAHILAVLRDRLDRRQSPYAAIFAALASLAAAQPGAEALAEIAAQPEDDPEDLAALDATWEEAAVTFGPDPNAGCPAGRELLARIHPPAEPQTWAGNGS
jgi:nitrate reductase delta subunit